MSFDPARNVFASAVTLCLLAGLSSPAMAVDPETAARQAILFGRALVYDQSLTERAGGTLTIAVLHPTGEDTDAERYRQGFEQLAGVQVAGLPVVVLLLPYGSSFANELETQNIDVVFVCEGLDAELAAITEATRAADVLSLASNEPYIEGGLSLGVLVGARGAPQLALNVAASKDEGASFSSDLLKLARVYR